MISYLHRHVCYRAPLQCAGLYRCLLHWQGVGCCTSESAGSVRPHSWPSTGTRRTSKTRLHSLENTNTFYVMYIFCYCNYTDSQNLPVTWAGLSVAVLILHRGSYAGAGVGPALFCRAATFPGSEASRTLLRTAGPRFPQSPAHTLGLGQSSPTGLHQVFNQGCKYTENCTLISFQSLST